MEEREFMVAADAELARLEAALEALQKTDTVDFDYELKPGGIIDVDFENGSKIIVNRHAAAREIWVAARSGGFHFRPPLDQGGVWTGSRDAVMLQECLSRCFSEQAGVAVRLAW